MNQLRKFLESAKPTYDGQHYEGDLGQLVSRSSPRRRRLVASFLAVAAAAALLIFVFGRSRQDAGDIVTNAVDKPKQTSRVATVDTSPVESDKLQTRKLLIERRRFGLPAYTLVPRQRAAKISGKPTTRLSAISTRPMNATGVETRRPLFGLPSLSLVATHIASLPGDSRPVRRFTTRPSQRPTVRPKWNTDVKPLIFRRHDHAT